jgi:SNF2 family DNA or RNA helicase
VDLIGDWLEVRFEHDVAISGPIRLLDARRISPGKWLVPASRIAALGAAVRGFPFEWTTGAREALDAAIARERWAVQQDRDGLAAKKGQLPSPGLLPQGLMPHQAVAAQFLAVRDGALLCDEQGLGKTFSALAAFQVIKAQGNADRLVVVCPNSLKSTWAREAAERFPEWTVSVSSGSKAQRRRAYGADADIYIANYEAARTDRAELRLLLGRAKSVLACDESHSAKNPDSRTVSALEFIRGSATKVWVMTGTPITNRLTDCYTQVHLADGGRLLGSRVTFWDKYGRNPGRNEAQDLQSRLSTIVLRRTKDDVLDLPERMFEDREIRLTGEQGRLYRQMRDSFYGEIAAMDEVGFASKTMNILTRLLRLVQIASNPRLVVPGYTGDPAKFVELDSLLEDLIEGNGRKVVLWSYYVRNIREFLVRYDRYHPVAIFGEVELAERTRAVERFQEDDSVRLFIGNPQAAGTGLTLNAAHHAIYETLSWRYDLYAQSLDRIHRIGQGHPVTYHRLFGEGTIDLGISESLERKRLMASDAMGDDIRGLEPTRQALLAMLAPAPASEGTSAKMPDSHG